MKYFNIHLFRLLLLAFVAGAGCRADESYFVPYEKSVGEVAQKIKTDLPDGATRTVFAMKDVSATTDTILMTANGTRIWLADMDNLFMDANGNPVQCSAAQEVKIEVIHALKISDLIGYGISTVSAGQVLETGGMALLRITVDGKEVALQPGQYIKIQLPVNSESELQPNMGTVYGQAKDNTVSNWQSSSQEVFWANWNTPSGKVYGYEVRCTQLGWVGSGKSVAGDKTTFCITTSSEFNGQNTLAWLIVPGIRSVIQMDGYDEAGKFCFGDAPIGYPVKLVTVSKIGGQWMLGTADTEVGSNGTAALAPATISEADLLAYLKSL